MVLLRSEHSNFIFGSNAYFVMNHCLQTGGETDGRLNLDTDIRVENPTAGRPNHSNKALEAILTVGFALVAGCADVVTFKAYGSFAALMTGNTVKLGLSVFDEKLKIIDAVYFFAIICSYIFGVWLYNLMKHFFPGRSGLASSPICLALFVMV